MGADVPLSIEREWVGGCIAQGTERAMVGESPPGCVLAGRAGGGWRLDMVERRGTEEGLPGANPADPSQVAPQGRGSPVSTCA